ALTLFPYTTLFRSGEEVRCRPCSDCPVRLPTAGSGSDGERAWVATAPSSSTPTASAVRPGLAARRRRNCSVAAARSAPNAPRTRLRYANLTEFGVVSPRLSGYDYRKLASTTW